MEGQSENLFGFTVDKKLSFQAHIHNACEQQAKNCMLLLVYSLVSGTLIYVGLEKSQKLISMVAKIRISWVENFLKITKKGNSVRDRM